MLHTPNNEVLIVVIRKIDVFALKDKNRDLEFDETQQTNDPIAERTETCLVTLRPIACFSGDRLRTFCVKCSEQKTCAYFKPNK